MPRQHKWVALALMCAAVLLACDAADAQVRRAKGWVRTPSEVVARMPLIARFHDYLPEEVDLSGKFPTPGDQGQQSSCTAWATGYALRTYYEGQRRRWNFSTPAQIISPAYIYNRLQNFRGSCDEGVSISDALNLLRADGAPTLAAYPYREDDCSRPPSPALARSGAEFRISGWSAIDSRKLDDAKGQLYRGNPIVFGMDVSEAFENLIGRGVYDDVSSPRTGGHAMVIVGYSERRQAFKVINSWGTEWGEGGFGWVSYRAIRQWGDNLFVIDVPAYEPPPEPVVKPQPVPPPKPIVVAPPPPPPAPEPVVKPEPVPPPKPIVVTPPPPKPVVTPPVATVRVQVASRLREVPCARIDGRIGADRVVRLAGFGGSADELAKLQTDLRAMAGVRRVESNVTLYPWPQCEVFLNFTDALKNRRGLTAKLRGTTAGKYAEGDSLAIEVVTPAYPSYLYVTYLQASGEAVNLSWPLGRFPKAYAPNQKVTFGGGAGGEPIYRVTPPLGDEIVVVVASASPLFQDEVPETETDRDYLTSFRKSFLVQPQGGGGQRVVSAVAVPLRTQARR